jgi:hypothetical protein
MSSTASVAQQLKNLFGGHSEAKNSFSDVVFDELGVWIPDKVSS